MPKVRQPPRKNCNRKTHKTEFQLPVLAIFAKTSSNRPRTTDTIPSLGLVHSPSKRDRAHLCYLQFLTRSIWQTRNFIEIMFDLIYFNNNGWNIKLIVTHVKYIMFLINLSNILDFAYSSLGKINKLEMPKNQTTALKLKIRGRNRRLGGWPRDTINPKPAYLYYPHMDTGNWGWVVWKTGDPAPTRASHQGRSGGSRVTWPPSLVTWCRIPQFPWQPSLLPWQQAPLPWQPRPEW